MVADPNPCFQLAPAPWRDRRVPHTPPREVRVAGTMACVQPCCLPRSPCLSVLPVCGVLACCPRRRSGTLPDALLRHTRATAAACAVTSNAVESTAFQNGPQTDAVNLSRQSNGVTFPDLVVKLSSLATESWKADLVLRVGARPLCQRVGFPA